MWLGREIVIETVAVGDLRRQIAAAPHCESGGPLVGYLQGTQIIVTGVGGAGKCGNRRPWSVLIAGGDTTAYLRAIHRRSKGAVYYVGEWHTHLAPPFELSATDRAAVRTLLASHVSPLPLIVSVVFSQDLEHATAYRITPHSERKIPVSMAVGQNPLVPGAEKTARVWPGPGGQVCI